MAEIRSAHAQINSSGENLSDGMLVYAHAMTLALPESFTTIKQTLWLQEPLTSSAVQAAVQAEWTMRSTEEVATGNRMLENHSQGNKHNGRAKAREWSEKWCSIHRVSSHNTRDCSLRKFNNNNRQSGQARVVNSEFAKTGAGIYLPCCYQLPISFLYGKTCLLWTWELYTTWSTTRTCFTTIGHQPLSKMSKLVMVLSFWLLAREL